jgi:hypothetical protein
MVGVRPKHSVGVRLPKAKWVERRVRSGGFSFHHPLRDPVRVLPDRTLAVGGHGARPGGSGCPTAGPSASRGGQVGRQLRRPLQPKRLGEVERVDPHRPRRVSRRKCELVQLAKQSDGALGAYYTLIHIWSVLTGDSESGELGVGAYGHNPCDVGPVSPLAGALPAQRRMPLAKRSRRARSSGSFCARFSSCCGSSFRS